jgi:seryl-tRNA synthetase
MMIDPRLLTEAPEATAAALARRGVDSAALARLRELDAARRASIASFDAARAEQKAASKDIGRRPPEERDAAIAAAAVLKERVAALEGERDSAESAHHDAFSRIPNLPHPDAPDGVEGDGVVLRTVGELPVLEGIDAPRDHVELLEDAGALDLARGAKVSGSRFAYLKGEGALLELALIRYAVDVAMQRGHVPVVPPVLVREPAMYGTGFLPTDEQQLFATRDDDLYLVGTSEVPLAGMHMDEVLDPSELPLRYAGISPCFRREAGAHGKDTRGIFRVHQFEKVELFSLVAAEDGDAEHERILDTQLAILGGLGCTRRSWTSLSATSDRPARRSPSSAPSSRSSSSTSGPTAVSLCPRRSCPTSAARSYWPLRSPPWAPASPAVASPCALPRRASEGWQSGRLHRS